MHVNAPEYSHRAPVSQAAGGGLQRKQGQPDGQNAERVAENEGATSVFAHHIREAPEVSQTDSRGD